MKMKKLLLVVTILLGLCCFLVSCNSTTNTNEVVLTNDITLTNENFEDYFMIEFDTALDITEHGGAVKDFYIPRTYTGVADVNFNVYATTPLDAYNVSVTFEVRNSTYWNTETITLNLNSSGSGSKSCTISTNDEETITSEWRLQGEFRFSIISVEGYIRTNQ